MTYLRSCLPSAPLSDSPTPSKQSAAAIVTALALTLAALSTPALAQDPPQDQPRTQADVYTVTIPAGTQLALVLTQPIQTRYVHRGDDIYAQITSPVNSGNEVVIPPGTFVQGTVDKIEQKSGRGELRLQSMSITFPDGYVAPIAGPITLESSDGYALKDPGRGRFAGAFAMPAAGAGLGALIGYAAANKQPGTLTSSLPPGCTGPPPGCLSSSLSVPAHPGMSIAMGAGIGTAVGMIASLVYLAGTHNFYLDAGSPVGMTLQQPVTLERNEVAAAVRQSVEHPVAAQPVAPRPRFVPPPDMPVDHGTCYTPGTTGTPDTVIPGTPGPDGIPGPPTIIPGIPASPGIPYPCP